MKHFLIERYRTELEGICSKHNLLLDEEVLTQRRDWYIQKGRAECYAFLWNKSFRDTDIGEAFGKHRTAIIYSINKHFPYKELIKR